MKMSLFPRQSVELGVFLRKGNISLSPSIKQVESAMRYFWQFPVPTSTHQIRPHVLSANLGQPLRSKHWSCLPLIFLLECGSLFASKACVD